MDQPHRRWGNTPWTYQPLAPPITRRAAAEVAIIGGGLTGASTAYHLAKHAISSTIYEAGRIGDGASGRTGGLALEGTAVGPLEEVDSCLAELRGLVAAEKIECGL